MPHRRSAARIGALLFLVLAATACGDDESSDVSTGPTVVVTTTTTAPTPTSTSPESTSTTPGSPTTAPRPTSPPATSPPVTSPPATDPPMTTPPGRTAALGSPFFIMIGETVTISSEGLSVTFSNVGPDSRCPPGVQCIQAGSASIGLTLAKAGSAPAVLALFTSEGPATAQYGPYTVELFRLTFGSPASANIRVT